MDAAVVAIKQRTRAKSRLSSGLSDEQRLAVVDALAADTLVLVTACDFFEWWVVTDDEDVYARAGELGLKRLRDEGKGLNNAVEHAVAACLEAGAASMTVIPADLPLATPQALRDLTDTGATSDVVLVASIGDGGTNALYLAPPDVLVPRFGPGSLAAHVAEADRLGLRCSVIAEGDLVWDLDAPEDIAPLLRAAEGRTGRTLEVLRSLPF